MAKMKELIYRREDYVKECLRWNKEHGDCPEYQYDIREILAIEQYPIRITRSNLGVDIDDDFLMFPEHFEQALSIESEYLTLLRKTNGKLYHNHRMHRSRMLAKEKSLKGGDVT